MNHVPIEPGQVFFFRLHERNLGDEGGPVEMEIVIDIGITTLPNWNYHGPLDEERVTWISKENPVMVASRITGRPYGFAAIGKP